MLPAPQPSKKALVLQYLNEGMSQGEVAAKVGVSRQYVNQLVVLRTTIGDDEILARRRGPKCGHGHTREPVFEHEISELDAFIRDHPTPASANFEGEQWTTRLYQDWFRDKFGKTIRRPRIRAMCKEHGIELPPDPDLYDPAAELPAGWNPDAIAKLDTAEDEAVPAANPAITMVQGSQKAFSNEQDALAAFYEELNRHKERRERLSQLAFTMKPGIKTGKHSKQQIQKKKKKKRR
jgi:transposase